jgi:hypothetical protein
VWVDGSWVGGGTAPSSDNYPDKDPPAPKYEPRPSPKAGQVWVSGRWEWKGGKWEWSAGRWQAEQTGKKWVDGKWEKQGGKWVWVDGSWVGGGSAPSSDNYPDKDPPAPKYEPKPSPKAGQVWISGRWEWKGGKWEWSAGRWEKQQGTKKWVDGKWEKQGGKWVWNEGRWE